MLAKLCNTKLEIANMFDFSTLIKDITFLSLLEVNVKYIP